MAIEVMNEPSMIEVLVVCALREVQVIRAVSVEPTCTIAEAVRRSAVLDEFAHLNPDSLSFAVFGRGVAGSQRVCDGDRVEILRALQVDPREARRRRALLKAASSHE